MRYLMTVCMFLIYACWLCDPPAMAKCASGGTFSTDVSTFEVTYHECRHAVAAIIDVQLLPGDSWASDPFAEHGASLEMYVDGRLVRRFSSPGRRGALRISIVDFDVNPGLHEMRMELVVNGAVLQSVRDCVRVE
jgi:hypothetical protein